MNVKTIVSKALIVGVLVAGTLVARPYFHGYIGKDALIAVRSSDDGGFQSPPVAFTFALQPIFEEFSRLFRSGVLTAEDFQNIRIQRPPNGDSGVTSQLIVYGPNKSESLFKFEKHFHALVGADATTKLNVRRLRLNDYVRDSLYLVVSSYNSQLCFDAKALPISVFPDNGEIIEDKAELQFSKLIAQNTNCFSAQDNKTHAFFLIATRSKNVKEKAWRLHYDPATLQAALDAPSRNNLAVPHLPP